MGGESIWQRVAEGGPLLLISYDSGAPGKVTSEWVDDKLRVLAKHRVGVTIVTSPQSTLESSPRVALRKPKSISWIDFGDELGADSSKRVSFGFRFVASTLGRAFDSLFKSLAGSNSYGKWSWVITAFPTALYNAIRFQSQYVLSTGGPSSAHLVGLLVKIFRPDVKLFVELQDPLIGTEMSLSPRSLKVLVFFETVLVRKAEKVVFVTQRAAERAEARHTRTGFVAQTIHAIYPGAWNFSIEHRGVNRANDGKITFFHLGSLYTTRNLDVVFEAIDELRARGNTSANRIQVENQGGLYVENPGRYLSRPDFSSSEIVDREEGLQRASASDFLLLVQHSDTRSEETIPYKTYDYLNLGKPILALTRNPELDDLIRAAGGIVASSTDLGKTISAIEIALKTREAGSLPTPSLGLSIEEQFAKIFE